jgi:hypothetical protein
MGLKPSCEIPKEYEVSNGILGILRDIFFLLIRSIGWGRENEIRNVFLT